MTNQLQTQELEILGRLKTDYEGRGYSFLLYPDSSELPDFLGNFRPDAIAVGEHERVILEVKSNPKSAAESRMVKFLAEEVPKHSGWRFELVLPDSIASMTDSDAEPDQPALDEELKNLRRHAAAKDYKVVLLVGWALLEAVTRKLALNEKYGESKRFLPRSIVESLVSEGFLDDSDGARLMLLAASRNRLAHGFTGIDLSNDDIEFLISTIDELLAEVK